MLGSLDFRTGRLDGQWWCFAILSLVAVARRRDGPQGHAVRTVATARNGYLLDIAKSLTCLWFPSANA